jgi:plasmid stabilization system protein ParE
MKVRYRELALSDLDRIFRYLDQRNPPGARKVAEAIRAAIDDVAEHPWSARRTSDPTVRMKVVSRYGYKIFYGVEMDTIEILHVRHGARQPWRAAEGHRKRGD